MTKSQTSLWSGGAKDDSLSWLSQLWNGIIWQWHGLVSLYIYFAILLCYSSIILVSGLIGRDEGLITLCHSCGFACQQRVLKTFAGPDYLLSKDGVVWLWHSFVSLHILLTIWSCYSSIPLALGLIGSDGGLNPLCHTCGFVCLQRVLKTFPSHGYLHSKDEVVWLWQSLVNMYIWLTIFILLLLSHFGSRVDLKGRWFGHFRS